MEPGELPLEQPDLSLGPLQPLIPGHQLNFIGLELLLLGRQLLLRLSQLASELPDPLSQLLGLVEGPGTILVSPGHRHAPCIE